MKMWLFAAMLFADIAVAQVLTPPRDMGLPESSYTRPDPAEYELSLDNGLVAYVAQSTYVPLVSMSVFVRAGHTTDTQQGAAETLHSVLKNSGPQGMTADAFAALPTVPCGLRSEAIQP